MKHIKTFESFLSESAFHAALAKAKEEGLEEFEFQGKTYPVKKEALKEGAINEATDKYYTVDWNRDAEKAIFDDCCPDIFDVDNLGFAFKGNAAFVFANIKDPKAKMGVDYHALENNKDFQKYFDLASSNLDSASQRMYTSYFRLNDRKI